MTFFAPLLPQVLSRSWRSAIWSINGFFLLMTVIVAYLPQSGSSSRQGVVQYLAQLSLANEKNLATYWEGWCLLLAALLAVERVLRTHTTAPYEKQSWLGLSILAAGLSLDELGSIHERAPFLFSSWGLSGNMSAQLPIAIFTLLILIFTLHRMWHLTNRRHFWLTLSAFTLFGAVAFQEYLEHALVWPWWARGLRFGIEEGTELGGVFLLLAAVLSAAHAPDTVKDVIHLAPRVETLIRLRPAVVVLTLVGCLPLAMLTSLGIDDATYRGIPASWLPFMAFNLTSMAAWACAQRGGMYRKRFLFVSFLALFLALDQILVFQRLIDKHLIRGDIANLLLPLLVAGCLAIPFLRTYTHILLCGALLLLNLLLIPASEILPWLVIPLQSLGIFWVLTAGLVATWGGCLHAPHNRCQMSVRSFPGGVVP